MSTWQWWVVALLGVLTLSAWSAVNLLGRAISLLTRIDELLVQIAGSTGSSSDSLTAMDTRQRWLHGDPSQEALAVMDEEEDLG